jgi:hypothetical protein
VVQAFKQCEAASCPLWLDRAGELTPIQWYGNAQYQVCGYPPYRADILNAARNGAVELSPLAIRGASTHPELAMNCFLFTEFALPQRLSAQPPGKRQYALLVASSSLARRRLLDWISKLIQHWGNRSQLELTGSMGKRMSKKITERPDNESTASTTAICEQTLRGIRYPNHMHQTIISHKPASPQDS